MYESSLRGLSLRFGLLQTERLILHGLPRLEFLLMKRLPQLLLIHVQLTDEPGLLMLSRQVMIQSLHYPLKVLRQFHE